jgi:hypothetical protein
MGLPSRIANQKYGTRTSAVAQEHLWAGADLKVEYATREDWMVETIWTKLHAPHAVIEPVSETRARNGIYCGRVRAAKWAHSPRLQKQRSR